MKVSELSGSLLDFWVAKAEGWDFFWSKHNYWRVTEPDGEAYSACQGWQPFDPYTGEKNKRPHPCEAIECFYPSQDWKDAGPIIERERIKVIPQTIGEKQWISAAPIPGTQLWRDPEFGTTPLIAAMRAYVASKFGKEVPDEISE